MAGDAQSAESVRDHEHVYRCQDCGEIGRAADPDAYAIGYQAGKIAGDATFYAKGYQDAFTSLQEAITDLFGRRANEPIPARIDGSGCAE